MEQLHDINYLYLDDDRNIIAYSKTERDVSEPKLAKQGVTTRLDSFDITEVIDNEVPFRYWKMRDVTFDVVIEMTDEEKKQVDAAINQNEHRREPFLIEDRETSTTSTKYINKAVLKVRLTGSYWIEFYSEVAGDLGPVDVRMHSNIVDDEVTMVSVSSRTFAPVTGFHKVTFTEGTDNQGEQGSICIQYRATVGTVRIRRARIRIREASDV